MDGAPDASDDRRVSRRQQEVVADLGRRALESGDLDPLLDDAAAAVVDVSRADSCVLLEFRSGADEGRLRATAGVPDEVVGDVTTARTGPGTHAGTAIGADGPVVVDDLRADGQFSVPEPIEGSDVESGVCVLVGPTDAPWGVLAAYGTERRSFSERDVHFLRSVANALAPAVESRRGANRVDGDRPPAEHDQSLTEQIVETVRDGVYALCDQDRFVLVNDAFCELTGYDREALLGAHASIVHSEAVNDRAASLAEAAMEGDEEPVLEVDLQTAGGGTVPVETRFVPYEYREGRLGRTGVVRDITERKRFEETLAALHDTSRELFRAASEDEVATLVVEAAVEVLDFSDVALYLYDEDRDDLYPVEKATEPDFMWEELPRVPPDGSTLVGHAYETGESVIEDDIRESAHFIDEETDMRAGVYASIGEYGAVFAGSTTIGAFDERARHLLELLAENTEAAFDRLERARRLVESERRYRTLVENFPNGAVGLFDEDLVYTAVGGELLDRIDLPPEQRVGKSLDEIHPDDLAAEIEPYFHAALSGETSSFEIEYQGRHLYASTLPVVDAADEIYAGMLVVQDATDRRRAEHELRESEAKFRMLAENLEEIVWMATPDAGEFIYVNPAFEDLWGRDRASLYENPFTFLEVVHPDDHERIEEAFAALPDREFDEEFRIVRPDGTVRWVHARGARVEEDDGEMVRIVGIGEDVTERKAREWRLEESNERLEQFAYAASHDLQEPLRMVSSYLQLIEDRYADALDEEGREFLAFAVDGAERMREMIASLLAYSRIEMQGDPFEPVDLDAVLGGVLEDLQIRIDESDAEITTDALPTVDGDGDQLRQVFQNLLDNAIEYSGDEPPRVHVSAERAGDLAHSVREGSSDSDSSSDGDEWIVSVADEGIGIDPADEARVFDVFERLHSREEHPGTGIGLALCERIIERHGGEIWVDSTPGEGATFSFALPAADNGDS